MRKRYKRNIDWNIFGKHCGTNIKGRLKYINGKPMLWVTRLNILLIALKFVFEKFCMDVPEVVALTSSWGWKLFNILAGIAFWVLFVDGVIVRILDSYTRGEYFCPYIVRLIKFPRLDNKADVKRELAWAHFLYTHPDFDCKEKELRNKYFANRFYADLEPDKEGYARAYKELWDSYGVMQDEKGRYFSWKDKKYQKYLEEI